MLAWLKKLFSSKKAEEIAPAAPAAPSAPAEIPAAPVKTMAGAEDSAEETSSEDMK